MDGCFIDEARPAFVQCVEKLDWNGEFVCAQSLRITMKPGPSMPPGKPGPLLGNEFVQYLDQFNVSTRRPGAPPSTPGVTFSGFGQGMEEGRGADGKPVYTLVVSIAFQDQRVSKDPAFRRCQTNGYPLKVSGHIGIATPK